MLPWEGEGGAALSMWRCGEEMGSSGILLYIHTYISQLLCLYGFLLHISPKKRRKKNETPHAARAARPLPLQVQEPMQHGALQLGGRPKAQVRWVAATEAVVDVEHAGARVPKVRP